MKVMLSKCKEKMQFDHYGSQTESNHAIHSTGQGIGKAP